MSEPSLQQVHDTVEKIILQYCDTADLGIERVEGEMSLTQELGIDSVDFLDIVFEIEDAYKIQFPLEEWSASSPNGEKNTHKMKDFVAAVYQIVQGAPVSA
ncbi:phosphopantetheine-binding protein [Pantoea sp. Tr-811]|uniref:phosphopantetheine-binding protein n=1 Tax=Pantoea sp. Tr-811 TaxID=2608361 RepID=UPI00141D7565|nr:phosphopantetheine-binding protein [Pantoea sp. Tr-811]